MNDQPRHYPISTSEHQCMDTHTNSSNHTLLSAIHVAYMVIWVKNCPQQALAQQNVPSYLRSTPTAATAPYVNRPNDPPSVLPQAFLLNSSQRLTQQLTTDYLISPHVWNEIDDKMNEMVEENRLIKQAHMKGPKLTIQGQETKYSQIRTIPKMTIANRQAKMARNPYSLGQKLRPLLIIHQIQ